MRMSVAAVLSLSAVHVSQISTSVNACKECVPEIKALENHPIGWHNIGGAAFGDENPPQFRGCIQPGGSYHQSLTNVSTKLLYGVT
jgi:hypothetical protein